MFLFTLSSLVPKLFLTDVIIFETEQVFISNPIISTSNMQQRNSMIFALNTLTHWVQQGNTIPNHDYNKAIQVIASKYNRIGVHQIQFAILRIALDPLEKILPDCICASLIPYFNTADKINIIRKLNKYWKKIVGHLTIK